MKGRIISLIVFIVISLAAGMIGSRFMPGAWYEGLAKPTWNPPNQVFAPVWTILYILMGVAAWMVWTSGDRIGIKLPIAVFIVQLAFNSLWSYLFFGLQRPDLAFFEIIVLWILICVTLILFWRISKPAGALLIPYLLWVSFATALNYQLWRLNI